MMRAGTSYVVIAAASFGACALLCGRIETAAAAAESESTDITEGSIPAPPPSRKITWSEVAKWPDFTTGLWVSVGGPGFGPPPGAAPPGAGPVGAGPAGPGTPRALEQLKGVPLKPEYAAQIQDLMRKQANGGASCEPTGIPAQDITFFSPHFYFARDTIIIGAWSDWYNGWRRIHMDRSDHGNPEPTYMGDSVGHWEGQTLVIDTVGIRAEAQLFRGVPVGNSSTHVTERIRLLDPNTLEWTKTVENPVTMTAPWTTKITKKRKTGEDFSESFCWRDLESGIAQ